MIGFGGPVTGGVVSPASAPVRWDGLLVDLSSGDLRPHEKAGVVLRDMHERAVAKTARLKSPILRKLTRRRLSNSCTTLSGSLSSCSVEPWLPQLSARIFSRLRHARCSQRCHRLSLLLWLGSLCEQAPFKPIAQNFLLIISSRRIEAISVTSFFEFAHDWLTQFPKLKRQIRGKSCPPFLSVQFNFGEVE